MEKEIIALLGRLDINEMHVVQDCQNEEDVQRGFLIKYPLFII